MEVKTTAGFKKWFEAQDKKVRVRIQSRLTNIELNDHFGDCEALKDGLFELRIHAGSGYRIYYSKKKGSVTILAGGDKSNQERMIKKLKKEM